MLDLLISILLRALMLAIAGLAAYRGLFSGEPPPRRLTTPLAA
jgi:hypothetical protein